MSKSRFSPSFIGIGAQKAGSTWVAALLDSHSQIYIPRKEIHFFDRHFDLGWDWYEHQFSFGSRRQLLTGEFTPKYMYDSRAASVIVGQLPETKLICILRDPALRAFSSYRMALHKSGFKESFSHFLEKNTETLERGYYCRQLARFQQHYRNGLLQVHIFEQAVREPDTLITALAGYLQIDPAGFSVPLATDARVGASKQPRFRRLRKTVAETGGYLRRRNMNHVAEFLIRHAMPIVRTVLEKKTMKVPIPEDALRKLSQLYEHDILELEQFLGVDLSVWRSHPKNNCKKSNNRLSSRVE